MPLSPPVYHYAAEEYDDAQRAQRLQARLVGLLLAGATLMVPYFWPEAFGSVTERNAHPVVMADVYYRNCAAARAAGAAPLYRGQPGYRPELDADNDGIACEPYRGR